MPSWAARRRATASMVIATRGRSFGRVPTDVDEMPAEGGQSVVASLVERLMAGSEVEGLAVRFDTEQQRRTCQVEPAGDVSGLVTDLMLEHPWRESVRRDASLDEALEP